jgi:hypothetical protein
MPVFTYGISIWYDDSIEDMLDDAMVQPLLEALAHGDKHILRESHKFIAERLSLSTAIKTFICIREAHSRGATDSKANTQSGSQTPTSSLR